LSTYLVDKHEVIQYLMTVVNPGKEEIKNQTDDSIIKGKSAKSEPELKKTKSSTDIFGPRNNDERVDHLLATVD
jgi:hypothetical protein